MARAIDTIELPDEISAMLEAMLHSDDTPNEDKLIAIGKALDTRKQEAVTYRQNCGIEATWLLCEESYSGIDDANRGEFSGTRMIKSTALGAPLTTNEMRKGRGNKKSTAFVRLTSRYVDAGSAKIGEILLPIDDKAFSFAPTPVPDLIKGKDDLSVMKDEMGRPMRRPMRPDEMTAQGTAVPPGGPIPQTDLTTKDVAEEALDVAMKKAKKAENHIFDWMVECQHQREMRKVIFDAARLGVGVAKGPYPSRRRTMARVKGADGANSVQVTETIVPVDKWVSAWNIFPDPACGEDIKNGDYIFERDFFSEKQVRQLKGLPGYIDSQIDKVLLIGPTPVTSTGRNPNDDSDRKTKHPYEIWFFHGTIAREDFEVINAKTAKTLPKETEQVNVIVTMIGDLVIRGSVNPLTSSGELPYHAVPWVRRPGFWAGVGVAEQLIVPQRIVNASTRALLNNAGVTAGPQIVINQKGIRPANGDWEVVPNKIWYLSEEGMTDDVRKAFLSFDITNTGDALGKVIEYGMRLAEESSSIPLITQGMSGKTTPDTLGATQLQDNNANQLLRSIGYGFDDYLTEPLVRQYYEYLLLDPNVDDDEKGDHLINAHGSIAMVERAIQDQTIAQMTPLAQNPVFGVDPKRWFAVLAKSKHLDPTMFQYTPEEQAKIDAQPKPQPPAIEVAKIKAQTVQMQIQADQQRAKEEDALAMELAKYDGQITLEAAKMQNTTAQLRVKLDTDRDTAFVQSETQRAKADFEHNMAMLSLKKELALMDYASKHQQTLDQVKAKLADTAMKLQQQKELAVMDTKLEVHKHHAPSGADLMKPPTQIPGRASNGEAFAQV